MVYLQDYDSALGKILLACDDCGLTGLWFKDQKYFGRGLSPRAEYASHPILSSASAWLDLYFSGQIPDFSVPLHPDVTPFQKSVLQKLLQIPYGETTSYGTIAREMTASSGGKRVSPRAVGGAVGRNPVSLIIPCHRVIGADGSLTGYAGGTERKRFLLAMEKNNRQDHPVLPAVLQLDLY